MARTADQSLVWLLSADFAPTKRRDGNTYAAEGRVQIHHGNAEQVVAVVRGSQSYPVHLRHEKGALIASCSCPYTSSSLSLCKHIWATIVEADSKGYLRD